MKLLLVEDEPEIIVEFLVQCGHAVDVATDGERGLALAASHAYDVIILDIMLPGTIDGFEVASDLRARGDSTPILMLTGRTAQSDIVRGLNAGADDYLTKPFGFPELDARIRALDRRRSDRNQQLRFGPIEIDRQKRTVRWGDDPIRLTATEFKLLEAMMLSPKRRVVREDVRRSVWGLDFDPGTRIIDTHIANLRRKLEENGRPRMVATLRGVGFQLVGHEDEML